VGRAPRLAELPPRGVSTGADRGSQGWPNLGARLDGGNVSAKVLVLIGTKKGGFILEGDAERQDWRLRDPVCEAWPINHFSADPARGALYAGGGSEWYGPAVWRSLDLGKTWGHSSEGLTYGGSSDAPRVAAPRPGEPQNLGGGVPEVRTVWSVVPSNGQVYAGVEPAGLFVSEDQGATWRHVSGLREHPSCPEWVAGGGGLCLHSIVPHPAVDKQVWVVISAAG
jgi:hypothetical protein